MADVRKTVEIALKVIGVDTSKLKDLTSSFEKIQVAVDNTKKAVDGLQTSLNSIKVPPALDKVLTSLQAIGKIKAPNLANIATGFKKLEAIKEPPSLTKFAEEIRKLDGIKLPGVTAMVNGFKKMEAVKVDDIATKISKLNTALAELDKKGGISAFKKFANDVSLMKNSFNDAAGATTKIKNALDEVQKKTKETGSVFGNFAEKVKTVFQFRAISLIFQQLGSSISAGATAIVEYDQALKDLQAITGATTLEVAQMGIKILEVASTTKFSASEVAQGMRTIGQAGFSAGEAVETMQAVSDLATGTLSDMSTTVDLVTTAMRVFRIDASQSAEVADVFANAVNRSKLTVDKLRTAMNYVGPIARDSGVSFKELAASMGTLANSGLRASTIGTGLRRVFAELIDPSKKLRAAAEEAGVALQELDPRTNSLQDVFSNLGLVLNDASVAFDVFGKRGASAALSLVSAESQFSTMLQTVGRSGTAAQQAAIQMEGLGVSFKNLKDKLGLLAIALGNSGVAGIMRVLINLSRFLVDALTALTNSGVGKLIVGLGLATAALYAFATAYGVMVSVVSLPAFAPVIASLGKVTVALKAATLGFRAFMVSIGPVGWILTGIAAVLTYFIATTDDVGDSALVAADKYARLTKQMNDYELAIVGLASDSKELGEENIKLRNSLFGIANEIPSVAEEARAAANSINALTGEFENGYAAIDAYNEKVNSMQLDSFVNAGNQINEVIKNQGNSVNTFINKSIGNFKNLSQIFSGNYLNLRKNTQEAANFAKEIYKGNVSVEEMEKTIASWDHSNLNDQQKEIVKNFAALEENAKKFTEYLIKSGQIGLDDTIENIEETAEGLGYTGKVLETVIKKVKELKEANEDTFTNILEKWSKDGIEDIQKFVTEYKKLGGDFGDGGEGEIQDLLALRERLAEKQKLLKEEAQAEAATADDKEAVWKAYYAKESILLKQAGEVRRALAENGTYQNILTLKKESESLDRTLKENEVKYKNSHQLRTKHNEEARAEYLKNEAKLIAGQEIDPKKQNIAYDSYLEERKVSHSKHLQEISLLEAKGVIDATEANSQKLLAEVNFNQESLANAIAHRDSIDKLDDSTEYNKRNDDVLKAEQDLYDSKTSIIQVYSKEISSINADILKEQKKLAKEDIKNSDKQVETANKRIQKLKALEKSYADKVLSIREALSKKLAKLDEKIARNRLDTTSDILDLEDSSAEKIRTVRKKFMTDEAKDASDRYAAYEYLKQGRELLEEAEKTADREKLDRGVKLIKQAESLATGFKDEGQAVSLLSKTLESLKGARNYEGELNELDLIKKKNEEVALAEEKRIKAKEGYDYKVSIAIEANDKIAADEDERHRRAVENISIEIAMLKQKADIAAGRLDSFDSDSVQDLANQYDDNAAKIKEETFALKERTKAQKEAKKSVEAFYETIDENGVRTFSNVFSTDDLDKEFKKVEKEGISAFENIGQEGEEAVEGISDSMTNEYAWDGFVESAKVAAQEGTKSFEQLGTDSVKSMTVVEKAVKDIGTELSKLKDKVITVTVNYVSSGSTPKGYADGGRLPGFGGGDRRVLLGEDGEWMINKFAVQKYGDPFFKALNNMTLPKFKNGGSIGTPSASNIVSSASDMLKDFGKVVLDTGSLKVPALINTNTFGDLESNLVKAKRFAT